MGYGVVYQIDHDLDNQLGIHLDEEEVLTRLDFQAVLADVWIGVAQCLLDDVVEELYGGI